MFSPDTYFKYNFEEEWFEDELVKEMVQDVDGSAVISAHAIDSPAPSFPPRPIPPCLCSAGSFPHHLPMDVKRSGRPPPLFTRSR